MPVLPSIKPAGIISPGRAVRENAISTSTPQSYRRFPHVATCLRLPACVKLPQFVALPKRFDMRWTEFAEMAFSLNRRASPVRLMMPTDPCGGRRGPSTGATPRSRKRNQSVTAMPSSQAPLSGDTNHFATHLFAAGKRPSESPVHAVSAAGPECVVCAQLAGADARYFGRLMRDARARTLLAQTVATSMGFCADHATVLASARKTARALDAPICEAARHLGSLLERAALQDELLQDILFNARGRCPACAYFHRSEGRALARVLKGLENTGRHARVPPLCFIHIQLLVQRTEPPLRGRFIRQLRNMARTAIEVLDAPLIASSTECVIAVRHILYPLARDATPRWQTPCECPVCEAIHAGRTQWLTSAAENVRLEQPGWITLPTCRNHLFLCLAQPDRELQRAALQRYLETALPARPVTPASGSSYAPKRRPRSRLRWFNAAGSAARANATSHAPEVVPRESCPGCDTEEIAARRAIARLIREVSRAQDDDHAARLTSGVCIKHFAEALIYASDPLIEHRLNTALCHTLRRDQHALPPPGFPGSADIQTKALLSGDA